ncbi:unnamed protein product [Mesocestoides corti]|uniref:Protein xylosyltransferase n=1 Tax=Mesocestoides corti TaxID=53468 RepID=A0A0R3UB22_MESCO|nr:unnamed protein product [Mesocestoides corti]
MFHLQRIQRRLLAALFIVTIAITLYFYTSCPQEMFVLTATNIKLSNTSYFAAITSPSHPYCRQFRQQFPMVSNADADMDIAFTLVVHKDIRQIARLLRMIYRNNNYYCIHVDRRSSSIFVEALQGIANCFGANVELVPHDERVAVNWGDETVLLPQITCGKKALKNHATWKYLVNLVGQDFPLRTNMELVAALKALNGSNLVESYPLSQFKSRVKDHVLPLGVRNKFMHFSVGAIRDIMLQPGNIMHPDEFFFSTLAYNSQFRLPGACLHGPAPLPEVNIGYLGRFVIWGDYGLRCRTKYVRFICIFGNPHVAMLQSVPHIAANKFHEDYQPEAYDEMEKWYFRRIAFEISTGSYNKSSFDPSTYANLSCSRNHL